MRNRIVISSLALMLAAFLLSFVCFATGEAKIRHDRTRDEVIEKHLEYPHSGFTAKTTEFKTAPVTKAPYSAGSLADEDVADALNALKMVRFLAGVPYENTVFTEEYNNISQHGAVLLASSNQFTHTPGKPIDMSQEFYDVAYKGCNLANLSAGKNNIANAIIGFVYDKGQNNISHAGHRRWVLRPGGVQYGIGFAKGDATYGGMRISMLVNTGAGAEADSFVAWPSSGAFPIQYFAASNTIENTVIDAPWSINLGAQYAAPTKATAVVKLTRESDGKVWIFDSSTPDLGAEMLSDDKLHYSVDNTGYGMKKGILIRPDLDSLGVIADGEIFTVEVSGIKYKDGKDATLSYSIEFFDLEKGIVEYTERKKAESTAYIPPFPVVMNGITVDNLNLRYPFILYNNITYFPMTYHDSRFLGIGTTYTAEEGLGVFRLTENGAEYKGELGDEPNPEELTISVAELPITVNGKTIINSEEEYPLLFFRDITYFPMTWRFGVDEFGWDYHFDSENGLVINTGKRDDE
ncbi:MAG: hypothetical protein IKU43_05280 [Clostridia bacterium]|nr:hypothetical protein [Clostridia bacterium]